MKRKLQMILLEVLLLPMFTLAQNVDLQRGLVAYYPFDGNANDMSGNRKNATPQNNYRYENGVNGQAIHLQAVGGWQGDGGGHVILPKIDLGNSGVTLSLWVKEEGLGYWHGEYYIGFCDESNEQGVLRIMHNGADKETQFTYHNYTIKTPFSYKDKWTMYTLSITKSGKMTAYVNGNKVGEQNVSYNGNIITSPAAIGRHWWENGKGTSTRFIGSIDEVRVYNRALTSIEIEKLYNNSSTDDEYNGSGNSNKIAYRDYRFFDDEPDYKLYEDNLNIKFNGFAYCEAMQKIYILDGSNNIIEYDITDAMNKNVGRRTFTLPFTVETDNNTMEVSPNGKYLAFVDINGEALHIVNTSTGKETATAFLGKKYINMHNSKSVGHPFAFISDNEVLVSGASKALLYNIARDKGKKLSFKKPYNESPKKYVTSRGQISGTDAEGHRFAYVLTDGKLSSPLFNINYIEHVDYISEVGIGKSEHLDKKTGNKIDKQLAGTDREKYKFMVSVSGTGKWELTTINNRKHYLSFDKSTNYIWLDNYRMFLILTNDNKIRIFNHTLTDNEMIKQYLLYISANGAVEDFDNFINENHNSRYVNVARQKRLDLIKEQWVQLSQPSNLSAAHAVEIREYIRRYGSEVNVDAAKAELDNLYKRALGKIGNSDIDGFEQYINTFPQSPYLNQAYEKKREAYRYSYEELCRKNDLQTYIDYVEKYPDSPYIKEVQERARTIYQQQQAEEQRLHEEEEQRKAEEFRQQNAAKLNCVGRTIYWREAVSYNLGNGGSGLIGSMIKSAMKMDRVEYNVLYTAVVEANLGETSVKCIITSAQIEDPRFVSANYIKYKSSAQASLNESLGQTRVKQLNEFELR